MNDIIDLNEVRERAESIRVCTMFEELTEAFATKAATYLASDHPEIWADDAVNSIAQSIITAYYCRDAYSILIKLAKSQAGSEEEFQRLRKILIPKKRRRQ